MVKYNYTYNIPFKAGVKYRYGRQNILINTTGYQNTIYKQLPYVIDTLKQDPTSRRAVVIVNHKTEEPGACLLNLQFQIDVVDKILYVTANYRSQCAHYGRPGDTNMLLHITDDVKKCLETEFKQVIITVNVANYHLRTDIIAEEEILNNK
jgi:thymidylate synthase